MKHFNVFLAIVMAVLVLGPLSMMLTLSLNPNEQDIMVSLGSLRSFIPQAFSLQNYIDILNDPFESIVRYFVNTFIIVIGVVGLGVLVNSAAAYVLAWGTGGYRKWYLAVIIGIFVIPFESLLMPLLLIVSRLGWLDTYQAQIVPFIASTFSIFLFYQFFSKLPKELIEAARIDGARPLQIYFRIALPLSTPIIATVAILGFLESWNSYLWPLLVTRGTEFRPLGVAMAAYFSSRQLYWGNVMAFAVLMSLPVIIIFLIFQRWFVASVVGSSVKG